MNQAKHGTVRPKPRLTVAALSIAFLLALTMGAYAQRASYSDLAQDHWAYDAVATLSQMGILTGYPDGRFDGTRAATRYELAVVAARVLEATSTGDRGENIAGRVAELETVLSQAASLSYSRRLENRIIALEVALNTQRGETTFLATLDDDEDTAALSQETLEDNTTPVANSSAMTGVVRLGERPAHPFYIGISPGVVSTAGDIYLSLQAGYDALLGPVGPALRLTFNSGNRELRFAFDVLGRADLPIDELKLSAGLGLGATLRPEGSSLLLEAPFGGEFLITERVGLFIQLITSYGFAPINDVNAEVSTGLNLRF